MVTHGAPFSPFIWNRTKCNLEYQRGKKRGRIAIPKQTLRSQSHISDNTEHSRAVSQRTGHRGLGLRFILVSFNSAAAALRSPQVSRHPDLRGNHKLLRGRARCVSLHMYNGATRCRRNSSLAFCVRLKPCCALDKFRRRSRRRWRRWRRRRRQWSRRWRSRVRARDPESAKKKMGLCFPKGS